MKYLLKKPYMGIVCFFMLLLFSNFTGGSNSSVYPKDDVRTFEITSMSGEDITLAVTGNVSVNQITNFFFLNLPDWYNNTNIDFNLIELNGNTAFVNITVPKNAILGGTEPVVAINGGLPSNNGFTQDTENFYVWFTAQSIWANINSSQVSVHFLLAPNHKATSFSRQTFIVPALETQIVNVRLGQGEILSGSVHLTHSIEKDFDFIVTDPKDHSIIQYDHTDSKTWKFTAEMNGIYTLAIVNPSASSINAVTLEYSVSNNAPINNGFTSLLSLFILGVIIVVGISLAVVFLTKRLKLKAGIKGVNP